MAAWYRTGLNLCQKLLLETRYSYNGNNSSSESSEFASNDQNSQSNTLTESSGTFYHQFYRLYHRYNFSQFYISDDEDVPIKKNKNRKNERDEIMAVIRKNPEDFGVRRSSRGPPTLSESSNDDDGSSSDSSEDFKPIKK